ncbi:MAG: DUF2634 domain-containing protein [Oscillospiraceae bacterium]|jgi:hypothetical protein|nr:DUF2634 domain-containing protein [Oscillospiraceae bacterium]
MIPQSFIPAGEKTEPPGETWRLGEDSVLSGRVDGLEALKQAVRLALGTERYQYPIYSWNYGAELRDLFGMPFSFVRPELQRRVRDALSRDGRITGVDGFCFENRGKALRCTFTVHTIFGPFGAEKTVGEDHVRTEYL